MIKVVRYLCLFFFSGGNKGTIAAAVATTLCRAAAPAVGPTVKAAVAAAVASLAAKLANNTARACEDVLAQVPNPTAAGTGLRSSTLRQRRRLPGGRHTAAWP